MAAYFAGLLIVACALVLGLATTRLCGLDGRSAPAAGLATLIALATLTVHLPGRATTAAVLCGLVVLAAAAWLVRGRLGRLDLPALGSALITGALTTLPFLSAGRVGIPGMSLNNDTAVHLLWAEGLRSPVMHDLYTPNPGYPLGPHSLMAMLAQATSVDMDHVLTGLLIATPILFAITVASLLRGVPGVLRALAAGFASMPYLAAAWYGQGAFKEPMVALLLLGFALAIDELLGRERRPERFSLVPAGLIAGGAVLTYSYLAVAWLGLTAVLCVVLHVATRRPRPAELVTAARAGVVPVLIGVAASLAAIAVELPRLWRYLRAVGASPAGGSGGIGEGDLGNLAAPLQARSVLGMWPSPDFRFPPGPERFLVSELQLLALVAVIAGAIWLVVRRRNLGLVAAFGASALIVVLSNHGQSPYVIAKALAVLSLFPLLIALAALLPHTRSRLAVAVGRVAVAAVLVAGGLWSSQLALRASPVESLAQHDQLAQLRPLVSPGPTLFMGSDDYAGWRLRDIRLAYAGSGYPPPLPVAVRPEKPYQYGNGLDWDSFDPATLDRFRYVVTTRGPYVSAAPANFRLLRSTPLFQAWERTGPTAPRATVDPSDAPFAPLDCAKDAKARSLTRQPGVASVLPAAPVPVAAGLPALFPGAATAVPLSLPAGDWQLAVKYTSPVSVRLQFDRTPIAALPSNTGRPGPWWPAGTFRSTGKAGSLSVIAERENRVTTNMTPASVSGIVAVRPGAERVIPLRRACGTVIDWYRP